MNSSFSGNGSNNYKYSSSTTSSLKNFDFDFGIGSNTNRGSSRPLKDQKNPSPFPSHPPSSTISSYSSSSFTANKPTWTHQPSAPKAAPNAARSGFSVTSSSSAPMVGDIFGKSWNSTALSSGIGLPKADPNLFGDLLGSSLGSGGKTGGNVPLKNMGQKTQHKPNSTFSMGNLSNSIPKTNINIPVPTTSPTTVNPMRPTSYAGPAASNNSSSSMGRPSMKPSSTSATATASFGINQKKDPFGSLMDFHSKPTSAATSSFEPNPPKVGVADGGDPFGSFSMPNITKDDDTFGSFHNSNAPKNDGIFGSFNAVNVIKDDTFGMPTASEFSSQKPSTKTSGDGVDPLDMLFSSSAMPTQAADDNQDNDWDLNAEYGDGDGDCTTTELEGLPPPPSGITATSAKNKGMDNYKQGQFPDAIKWLSWASVILEKSGDSSALADVLACRASCFKEVGEYKKAISDCTKVLEDDNKNVSVLVQRALLYESTEKYKLGAEDLRTVLKIDPMNRLARTTVHRLSQLAG